MTSPTSLHNKPSKPVSGKIALHTLHAVRIFQSAITHALWGNISCMKMHSPSLPAKISQIGEGSGILKDQDAIRYPPAPELTYPFTVRYFWVHDFLFQRWKPHVIVPWRVCFPNFNTPLSDARLSLTRYIRSTGEMWKPCFAGSGFSRWIGRRHVMILSEVECLGILPVCLHDFSDVS